MALLGAALVVIFVLILIEWVVRTLFDRPTDIPAVWLPLLGVSPLGAAILAKLLMSAGPCYGNPDCDLSYLMGPGRASIPAEYMEIIYSALAAVPTLIALLWLAVSVIIWVLFIYQLFRAGVRWVGW